MNRASHTGLGHDVVAEGLNSGRLSAPKLRIMTAAVKGKEINKDTLHDEGRDSCDLIAVNNRELIGALEIIPSLALNCMEFTPKMVHSQTSNKPMQQVRVSSKAPNNSPLSESRVKDYGAEELGQLKDGGPSLRQMSPNTDSMGRTDSRLKQVGGQLNSLIFSANGTESTHSERPPDASKKEEVGPVFVFTSKEKKKRWKRLACMAQDLDPNAKRSLPEDSFSSFHKKLNNFFSFFPRFHQYLR
ncbi:hypothetical protein ACOSP7_015222 [Xanthoceras sorbifolium]